MLIISIFLVVIGFMLMPFEVHAWSLETHIKIGVDILSNISYSLIKQYPVYFLLGNIFPDFFTIFKNVSNFKKNLSTHSWDTVSMLFKNAEDGDELSFAHGYAAHLSADIIAHNYFVPQNYLLISKRKFVSHFMMEAADKHFKDVSYYLTLIYLLDFAEENSDLFLRTFNIEKTYFLKQLRYLKLSLKYQHILKLQHIARKIDRMIIPEFINRCRAYRAKAYEVAYDAVDSGFSKYMNYDPTGRERMLKAKNNRKKMIKDIGALNLRRAAGSKTFVRNYSPDNMELRR